MKTRTGTKVLFILAGVLAASISGAAWWWQAAGYRQSVALAALPPSSDLSGVADALTERIATAKGRAQTRLHALSGLAELSRLYHANGFLDEATRCYSGLEQIEPREPRWLHLHATILAGYGELEPALQLWQRVVQLAPNTIPARLRIGDAQLKANRADLASAAYSSVLQREPANPYALFGLARIDFEADRLTQARERLETVVNQTNYEIGYDLIVSLYERLGETDRALAIRAAAKASGAYRDPPDPWLDALIDDCFDPNRLALAAGVAARTRQAPTAFRLLERAIELAPNDVSARFQLGCLALDQGNFRLAREQLERCTSLSPDFADAWAWLSMLHANSGDSAAARQVLSTGLRNCPQSPGLHLARGRDLLQTGKFDDAANEFMISIRLRPNESDAYIELGKMLIGAGRTDEGVEQIRQALIAEPGNPAAISTLAFYTITTGNEAESNRWLASVQQQPRVPRDTVNRLLTAYREVFGHDFVAAR